MGDQSTFRREETVSYEDLSDRDLEQQLNPRLAVPDFEEKLARYVRASELARAELGPPREVAYGESALQTADVFAGPGADAPINVFVHGGYWRALDKRDHSFVAPPLVAAGACAVIINYELCPAVTVDDIVEQVRRAIVWAYDEPASVPGDRDRFFVSGHSAGAHLAAMAMATDWSARGLPADAVKGYAAVSGIYELAPVLRVSVNQEIRLTPEMAARNSPTLAPPPPVAPLLLAVGERETPAWIRQSTDFAAACEKNSVDVTYLPVPGMDHFEIGASLGDAESPVVRAILAQMGLG